MEDMLDQEEVHRTRHSRGCICLGHRHRTGIRHILILNTHLTPRIR